MKRLLLFFMFALFVNSSYAQYISEKTALILIPVKGHGSYKYPRLKLRSNCVSIPIKVQLTIQFDFHNALNDTTKATKLKEAKLWRLSYTRSDSIIQLSRNDHYRTSFDKCIWEKCSDIVNYWTKEQPYEKLDYKLIEGYLQALEHGHAAKSFIRRLDILFIPNK